jgi:hypothetical protein
MPLRIVDGGEGAWAKEVVQSPTRGMRVTLAPRPCALGEPGEPVDQLPRRCVATSSRLGLPIHSLHWSTRPRARSAGDRFRCPLRRLAIGLRLDRHGLSSWKESHWRHSSPATFGLCSGEPGEPVDQLPRRCVATSSRLGLPIHSVHWSTRPRARSAGDRFRCPLRRFAIGLRLDRHGLGSWKESHWRHSSRQPRHPISPAPPRAHCGARGSISAVRVTLAPRPRSAVHWVNQVNLWTSCRGGASRRAAASAY